MDIISFTDLIETKLSDYKKTLLLKNEEYGTDDVLQNFKTSAAMQNCKPCTALAGMMCKHTTSIYDMIRSMECGGIFSAEKWDEKIGDHINYLLLLRALIADEADGYILPICPDIISSCQNCGSNILKVSGERFCSHCGTEVTK